MYNGTEGNIARMSTPFNTYTDNPIETSDEDLLGFIPYVSLVKSAMLSAQKLPLCVGIFGAWGTGKTSFMQLLKQAVEAEQKIKTVWFNPWKYDKKEDLWHALIQTVIDTMYPDSSLRDSQEPLHQIGWRLIRSATWLAVKKISTAATINILKEEDLDELMSSLAEHDKKYIGHINSFEQDFKELVTAYTQGGKLVIFIDDLDRCLPENAITILESLKLFIGDANCIFVLGMDHTIIQDGIDQRYDGKLSISGRDYLDKIIQIPFYLPRAAIEQLRHYEDEQRFSEQIWHILYSGMGGNPRKAKRYLNSFMLVRQFVEETLVDRIRQQTGQLVELRHLEIYLAVLLAFQLSFPDFYENLQTSPGTWRSLVEAISSQTDVQDQILQKYLDDRRLKAFFLSMLDNEYVGFPLPPDAALTDLLMQYANFVTSR
jgi:hypothetical protein